MTTAGYSAISIIYNPVSTGQSKRQALALRRTLRRSMPELKNRINTVLTEYAGHAEVLAYQLAKASPRPLIIASGGDGSYHEIVNGAMRAQSEGAKPVCGLLPGGNANDHYHNLKQTELQAFQIEDQIIAGKHQTIDLLRVTIKTAGQVRQRYAHSYCGFGLTADAGRELNKSKLNPLREAMIILRILRRLRSKRVIVRGRQQAYTSLVCSNVARMSKILQLSDKPRLRDGKFELIRSRGSRKSVLIRSLLKASTIGLREARQTDHFSFTTIRPLHLQIDGEIYRIKGNTEVDITIAKRLLRCVA